ncbi:MAG: FtsQ-type POTRA domain-containing protein [Candidatus Aminicenantes bacterium]|nr:FtsQ-type POTRA domain-containing protein [Candidatus Aminicenantes bacterium]
MSGQFRRGAGNVRVKKPAKGHRLRLPLVIVGLGALGLLFLGVYELYGFLLTWEELSISTVEVRCPDPAVAARAEEIVGKVSWGNILLLDVDKVLALLERSPFVAAARVRKIFPAALRVDVAPRRPAAVLEEGESVLIGRDNVVLGPAGPEEGFRWPTFRDESNFAADREGKLARAWACLEELGPTLTEEVEALDLSEPWTVVLVLRGDPTRLKLGTELFRPRVREWLAERERMTQAYGPMEYADLRFAGRMIYKPAVPPAGSGLEAVPAPPAGTGTGETRPPGP